MPPQASFLTKSRRSAGACFFCCQPVVVWRSHQTRVAHRTRFSIPVRWGVASQPQPHRRRVCVITFIHANRIIFLFSSAGSTVSCSSKFPIGQTNKTSLIAAQHTCSFHQNTPGITLYGTFSAHASHWAPNCFLNNASSVGARHNILQSTYASTEHHATAYACPPIVPCQPARAHHEAGPKCTSSVPMTPSTTPL